MLAHHPITGAPIRILETKTQIASDSKTLVWVRSTFKESDKWGRWFPVVSEAGAVGLLRGGAVTAVVLDADAVASEWADVWSAAVGGETLLLAPSRVVDTFAAAGLTCERTLLMEDLYDMYPFLGEPLSVSGDGDALVAKGVVALAHVLRLNRIAWTLGAERDALPVGVRAMVDAWRRAVGAGAPLISLSTDADDSIVPRLWLIQQYFQHPNSRRHREIRTCLERNLACPYVDHVLLLNEKVYEDLPTSSKLTCATLGHRLTFADVFKAIQSTVPSGDFVAFANSDIWFEESLKHLWRLGMVERRLFLALLRWEDSGEEPTIFGPRSDSQDVWILAKDCVDFEVNEDLDFPFGKPGCDNAITLIMMRHKFLVANPAYTIRTMHLHNTEIRNYDPNDALYKTHYLYVEPTHLQTFGVVHDMKGSAFAPPPTVSAAWSTRRLGTSFARPLRGVRDSDVATVVSMLRRGDEDRDVPWGFTNDGANLWTPSPSAAPLYRFSSTAASPGFFVSGDGLVSDFRSIYTGGHPLWTAGWQSTTQSALTSSIHVPSLVAVPCEPAWTTDLGTWALHYLSRALSVRDAVQSETGAGLQVPEFLVPSLPNIGAFLGDCKWPSSGNITIVPYMNDMNYYANCVWAVPPTNVHAAVTAEDVELLRDLLPEAPALRDGDQKPVAVFCVEDDESAVCTRGWAEEVAETLLASTAASAAAGSSGWEIRYVSSSDMPATRRKAFKDASWIFGASGPALNWLWLAPPGATVMEFMTDSSPSGTHIHLAGACGLRHVIGLVKREPLLQQKQHALLDAGLALRKYGFRELLAAPRSSSTAVTKPKIVLPAGAALQGIWNHVGDTFREMVTLWEERGYVEVERNESTPYCWWGGVGEVLLYDRPTPRWWNPDTPYQMALFGNCAPPGPGPHTLKQSVWGFWGRSPAALEGIAQRVENMRGYDSRPIASLFLGKVENGVQRAARCGADWSTCVELFSMPIDSTGAPYPFTQAQYLEKLCNARYGLCLPGFGPKCNREIEYFACGCVPIVTPGVDMKGYLVPPKEGVHYFTASTPADVRRIVETTKPEKWAVMSAAGREWWRTYASAEGFFRLTWARIEQCKPYVHVGLPSKFLF
jgi:hypothetical protein